ncbi:784b5f68-a4a3-445d-bae7-a36abd1e7336 [Thermothielavioides terrestris]|uniref:784b5f68-a4a3-445d-bae7-a36abd1e7336 n=1 Tax=Thermothielavioides terrestris TaxID=2587410 RepID=A0A3S4AW74_9PEZI|nr:784b5f68-a4a3-445d-bae7-a36abd1e7336 [Thermothielavioides terrestris]
MAASAHPQQWSTLFTTMSEIHNVLQLAEGDISLADWASSTGEAVPRIWERERRHVSKATDQGSSKETLQSGGFYE